MAGGTGLSYACLVDLTPLCLGHGTGHGVGSFLNVHEGPHGVSFRASNNEISLKEGMTLTDGFNLPLL